MNYLAYLVGAYILGSIPFSILVTKLAVGTDVRDSGSGHATTTNTVRQVGWFAGSIVLILDITKGYLPIWFALENNIPEIWIAFTLMFGIIGHCWPIFANFRGGMGLATYGGGLLAINPILFLAALALFISMTLLIKHSAKAAVFFGILFPVLVWRFSKIDLEIISAFSGGIIIMIRFTTDWNRKYKELWLDRDKA